MKLLGQILGSSFLGLGTGLLAAFWMAALGSLLFKQTLVQAYPPADRPTIQSRITIFQAVALAAAVLLLGGSFAWDTSYSQTVRAVFLNPTFLFTFLSLLLFSFTIAPQALEISASMAAKYPDYVRAINKQILVRYLSITTTIGVLSSLASLGGQLLRAGEITPAIITTLLGVGIGLVRMTQSISNSYGDVATMLLYKGTTFEPGSGLRDMDAAYRTLLNRPIADWTLPLITMSLIILFEDRLFRIVT